MQSNILSDVIITKVFSANNFFGAKGGSSCHERRNWAMLLKYEGETEYQSGGKKYTSNINNIVLLPKKSAYTWKCEKEGRFFVVEFETNISCEHILTIPLKNPEGYLKRFSELVKGWTDHGASYNLETMHLLYEMLSKLLKSSSVYTPSSKQERLRPALEYIAANYSKDISNDELAELLNISTVYFRKLFTDTMHISPIRYLHQYRLKKAKEMLKGDYISISDISDSLGYSSIYYFSKVFKQYTGTSPAQYAKRQ